MINFISRLFTLLTLACTVIFFIISCSNEDSLVNKDKLDSIDNSTNIARERKTSNVLVKFIASDTYKNHQIFINRYGRLNEAESSLLSLNDYGGGKNELLIIPIVDIKNNVTAVLEVVDLETRGFLPNADVYAINLVDYTKFDLRSRSGKVKMYDLNYGESLHSSITIDKNIILDWKTIPVTYKGNNRIKSNGLYKLCDKNKDLDISFFECYSCAKEAISGSGTFAEWFCDIPFLGWHTTCFTTISAACVVVSSKY
jgi:hypothetical protein